MLRLPGVEVEVTGADAGEVEAVARALAGEVLVAGGPADVPPPPVAGPAQADRLRDLGEKLPSFRDDLRSLETLLGVDVPSALNKVRYITEKALHGLCAAKGVSWGQAEPTLERMVGPLLAAGFIPKDVAVHVRTVQANASPGSHYQQSPLSEAHARIAHAALVEFLDWYSGAVAVDL
jgi:hypothetical protein